MWQQAGADGSGSLLLFLAAVLLVHKLLSCLPHCATPSAAQTSCGDPLVGALFTSKQSAGHITAQKELEIIPMLCLNECGYQHRGGNIPVSLHQIPASSELNTHVQRVVTRNRREIRPKDIEEGVSVRVQMLHLHMHLKKMPRFCSSSLCGGVSAGLASERVFKVGSCIIMQKLQQYWVYKVRARFKMGLSFLFIAQAQNKLRPGYNFT